MKKLSPSIILCNHTHITYCYLFRRNSSEVKDCPVVAVGSDQSRAARSIGVFRGTLAANARLYRGQTTGMSVWEQNVNTYVGNTRCT